SLADILDSLDPLSGGVLEINPLAGRGPPRAHRSIALPKHFFAFWNLLELRFQRFAPYPLRGLGYDLVIGLRAIGPRQKRIMPIAFDLPTIQLIALHRLLKDLAIGSHQNQHSCEAGDYLPAKHHSSSHPMRLMLDASITPSISSIVLGTRAESTS